MRRAANRRAGLMAKPTRALRSSGSQKGSYRGLGVGNRKHSDHREVRDREYEDGSGEDLNGTRS